jgi:uncharacterized YccA/Bax inhibitor family protein
MTGNPVFSESTFQDARPVAANQAMTVQGTVNKTAILLLLTVGAGSYTWNLLRGEQAGAAQAWVIGGAIVGFILAIVTSFKKTWSPVTAPLYALAEGLFIGGISYIFERQMPGVVSQAVMLTFGTLAALLAAYSTGIIKATSAFKRGVIAATGGIALVYLVSMVLRMFNVQIPGIFGSGAIGIGFSVVVVIIAALNLVMDFDFIENGAQQGAPKYMEWYAGFGLLVTLVWLYLEILRLLSKLNRR